MSRLTRGKALKSFGGYCAKLAGVPDPILQRGEVWSNALAMHQPWPMTWTLQPALDQLAKDFLQLELDLSTSQDWIARLRLDE